MRVQIPYPPPVECKDELAIGQPTNFQVEFLTRLEPVQLAMWGISTGKTLTGVAKLLLHHMGNPGMKGMIVCMTHSAFGDTIEPIIDDMRDRWLRLYGWDPILRITKGNRRKIIWQNGGIDFIMSGDKPDSIRGQTVGLLWIDELGAMDRPDEVWTNSLGRLRGRGPQIAYITSTPQGDTGPIGHILEARRNFDPNTFVSRVATWENPYLPAGFIERFRASCSAEFFRQECGGEALRSRGLVYPEFSRHSHIIPWAKTDVRKMGEVFVGIDWGFSHAHVVFCHVRPSDRGGFPNIVVFDEIGMDSKGDDSLIKAIMAKVEKLGKIPHGYCPDPAGQEGIFELRRILRKYGHGSRVVWERDYERRRIHRSAELVRRGLMSASGDIHIKFAESLLMNGFNGKGSNGIIQSLENYRRKKAANNTYDVKPFDDNFYTHACDALRYVILSLPHLGYSVLPPDIAGKPGQGQFPRGLPSEGLE